MKLPLLLAAGVAAAPAAAAAQTLTITIPQIAEPEYHKPHVVVWLEPVAGGAPRTLVIWHTKTKDDPDGTRWFNHLRMWWRQAGRSMAMPADGVSGETRAPGAHRIILPSDIAPGAYRLHVEAVREVGGREIVSLPVTFPNPNARATGTTELGAITISAR